MISLNPDGVQQGHHGECRVSPLDDPESNLHKFKTALAQMTECDWRIPGSKTCHTAQMSQWLALCGMSYQVLSCICAEHDVVSDGNEETSEHWS